MYKKVNQEINNVINDNIEKIKRIFPMAFKEGKIDVEVLKEELGDYNEVEEEKYELTWAGKQAAKKKAQEDIINKTLCYCKGIGIDEESTENIYIEGDNFDALRLIRQNYYSSIKLIYIDPPYNTGNDFIYSDSFLMDQRESDIVSGFVDEEGERFTLNKNNQNRYHACWLNMIYPRIKIAKDLLCDDGVIFISIDDNEVDNLKKICNEIFGEENFLAQIVWERAYSPINLKKHFSESHDYILCYSKNKDNLICNGLPRSEEANDRYANPDGDPRGDWKSSDLSVGPIVESKVYEIVTPSGRRVLPPNGYCWRLDRDKFDEYVKDNRIWFGSDGNNVPSIKRFLSEVKQGITPMTIWKYSEVGHSQEAAQQLKKLFDDKAYFDYPKPVELVKRCIQLYTDKDSVIMDFFGGSATTAHAVMKMNAEDGGKRKYILVQLPEKTDPKSNAYKDGYDNICKIGEDRIKRAGKKIKDDYPDANIDIGFKVFRISNSNIRWNSFDNYGQLDMSHIKNAPDLVDFMPNAKDIDVVYELMLRQRDIALSEKMECLDYIGKRTYLYAYSYIVCLETKITEEMIEKLASINPMPIKFILRDSAFRDDIVLKDVTIRRLNALIDKNAGSQKRAYTVEFI